VSVINWPMKIMTCNSTTKVDNKEEFVESVVLFI